MDPHPRAESPIKRWAKRHSPIKARSKPLPAPPPSNPPPPHRRTRSESPTKRAPLARANTNTNRGAPPQLTLQLDEKPQAKPKDLTHLTQPKESKEQREHKEPKTKRALSALFKPRLASAAAQASEKTLNNLRDRRPGSSSEPDPASIPRAHTSLATTRPTTPGGSSVRQRALTHSPTFRNLTQRVTSLESELKAARDALSMQRAPSGRNRRSTSVDSEAISRDSEVRQERLARGGRYDGLVESLLKKDYASASASASRRSMSGNRTGFVDVEKNRRSDKRVSSWKQPSDYEALNQHHRRTVSYAAGATPSAAGLKRSRTPESLQTLDEASTNAEERPSRRVKYTVDKELPEIPDPRTSSSTRNFSRLSSREEQDAASKTGHKAERKGRTAQAPPRTQYYSSSQAQAHNQSKSLKRSHERDETSPERVAKVAKKPDAGTIKTIGLEGNKTIVSPSRSRISPPKKPGDESGSDVGIVTPSGRYHSSQGERDAVVRLETGHQKRDIRQTSGESKMIDRKRPISVSQSQMVEKIERKTANWDVEGSPEPQTETESEKGTEADGEDGDDVTGRGPPSPQRRHVPSPSRLHTVNEEFEWDEEIF